MTEFEKSLIEALGAIRAELRLLSFGGGDVGGVYNPETPGAIEGLTMHLDNKLDAIAGGLDEFTLLMDDQLDDINDGLARINNVFDGSSGADTVISRGLSGVSERLTAVCDRLDTISNDLGKLRSAFYG